MKKLKRSLVALVVIGFVACTASQIQQAEALIGVILQDTPAILQILAGAGVLSSQQLTVANAAAGQATSDFALVETLIKDYQAQPSVTTAQKIQAALGDAETNLNAILTAARVLNPQKQAKIQGAVTLIINTANQIAAVFPTTATAGSVKASNTVKLPSVKDFQKQFNAAIAK